jgi:hypothetical protein
LDVATSLRARRLCAPPGDDCRCVDRLGELWDDLRILLLLIVVIFLAMAMSGDDVMAADP